VAEVADRVRFVADDDPGREAQDLLAAVLGQPRWWAAAHSVTPMPDAVAIRVRAAAARRALGMPFAYAVGEAAFRHLTLAVDARVLIPRPETELLVDLVLEHVRPAPGGIAIDVGTGSGAIALALASEGAFDRVIGIDVSTDALVVARANACRLPAPMASAVEFRDGSYLAPARDVRARAVVSNPPYIAFSEAAALPAAVRSWEPPVALLTGSDGLCATDAIVREAADILEPAGVLVLEVDCRRAGRAAELAAADGRYAGIEVRRDLAGRDRYVVAIRR
jgi:release factor glutamine methyltransferase